MWIAVLGAGAVGGTVARRWADAGHEVAVGVRDRTSPSAERVAESLGSSRVMSLADATRSADVVLVAIPGGAAAGVVGAIVSELDGKLVIDASNNVGAPVRNSIAAISAAAPASRPFRAFNSLPAPTLADPNFGGRAADLYYCGPEGPDKSTVDSLIRDAGLNPIHVGGLEWAPVVDALGGLAFALGRTRPGLRLAFNLVTA